MENIVPINGGGSWREGYRYSAYEHKLVTVEGL